MGHVNLARQKPVPSITHHQIVATENLEGLKVAMDSVQIQLNITQHVLGFGTIQNRRSGTTSRTRIFSIVFELRVDWLMIKSIALPVTNERKNLP
jgi:hypothetical protein